jgi:TrpR-related protein YerC/YecD
MTDKSWQNPKSDHLFQAFLQLKTKEEVANFCRDLMTVDEINQFADRWAAAQSLYDGHSQRATSKETGVSIVTVTRVNHWLRRGMGGYKLVLDRISKLLPTESKDKSLTAT